MLLIVDEFQVLFNDDDADAAECLQLLDAIVRQGRAFGVHAILGTQTLRGHGHMSQLSGTLDQVALRIVLKTSEADSRRFLTDDNPAAALDSRGPVKPSSTLMGDVSRATLCSRWRSPPTRAETVW